MARLEYTIKSRKLQREVTFSIPGKSYVYVDLNNKQGALGNQICTGGELTGSTIIFQGENEDLFKKTCRRWWELFLKKENHIHYNIT